MRPILFMWSAVIAILTAPAVAAPVHLDVPGAHIIVTRPIDTWSGNRASSEYGLNGRKLKKVSFYYVDAVGKQTRSSSNPDSSPGPTSMEKQYQEGLAKYGFTNRGPSGISSVLGLPVSVDPEQMPSLLSAQDNLYREYVTRQGNPATLPDRIGMTRFLNVVATLAFVNIGMDKLGNIDGANLVFSLGLPDELAKLTLGQRRALATVPAPSYDFSQYKAVDVRKLTNDLDRFGQIIIAYKEAKSQEVEDRALAAALVTASGADTTNEAIELSRAEDLAKRMRIWDACVQAARCKN